MKKLFAGLLVALLLGCSANARTQQKSSTSGKAAIDFPKLLASKDGKTESESVDIYRQEFEKFKKLCVEEPELLADMIHTFTIKSKAQGYKGSTYLKTLQSFIQTAESGFERKPGSCIQLYKTYLDSLQEEPSK